MINPFREVNWQPGPAEKRKFAWSLVVGFPCLAVAFLFVRRVMTGIWVFEPALWLGGVGLGIGVLFLALPRIATPFYLAWYFLACCIGIVVSNVLFAAFYYLAVTPVELLFRVIGRPPLRKAPDGQAKTYWQDAEQVSDLTRSYRQF